MAVTVPSDIFSPELVAQLASEQAFESIPLLQSGYINDARTNAVKSGAGDTISFPFTKDVVGNAKVQTNPRNGTQVTSDSLALGFEDVPIESRIMSFANDEKALRKLAQFKDPDQYMADLYKQYMSEHIQDAMVATANTTTLEEDLAGPVTLAGIKKAIIKKWGDKANQFTPLVVLHSNVAYDLEVSTELTNARTNGGDALQSSPIMNVAGINWMMLDAVPVTTADVPDTFSNFILAPGAIDLWMDPSADGYGEMRRERSTTWVSDFWFEFATHLAKSNPAKVIRLKTTSSLVTT